MQQIKSVKLRFNKWKHSTQKAHLLVYKGKEVWLPKKLCRDFLIAGNDQHAWATIPSFVFEKITGHNIDEIANEIGTLDLKESFGAIIHTVITHHKPTPVAPVENNFIQELKK